MQANIADPLRALDKPVCTGQQPGLVRGYLSKNSRTLANAAMLLSMLRPTCSGLSHGHTAALPSLPTASKSVLPITSL